MSLEAYVAGNLIHNIGGALIGETVYPKELVALVNEALQHYRDTMGCSWLDLAELARLDIVGISQRELEIYEGLRAFNEAHCSELFAYPKGRFIVTVRDVCECEYPGGLSGTLRDGWLEFDLLWLSAECRGQGIGGHLIAEAEKFARQRKCFGMRTSTWDWQARGFYEKCGFTLYGELSDSPPGHTDYLLKKVLEY